MGTEADLRKLKLNKARNVLRNFGVPEEEVNLMYRFWLLVVLYSRGLILMIFSSLAKIKPATFIHYVHAQ